MTRPYAQLSPFALARGEAAAGGVDGVAPPFKGAVVKLTTNETLTTIVPVPWDAAVSDEGGWWVIGSPTKLTVPTGVTRVRVTWNWNLTAAHADLQVFPEKNGSPFDGGGYNRQQGAGVGIFGGSAIVEVVAGDFFELVPTFSSGSPIFRADTVGSTFFAIEAVVTGRPSLLHVRHEETSGTAGGASAAATWNVRVLNTQLTNEISGASLAANQITLPAGTYEIRATAPCLNSDRHKLRLRDTTGATDLLIGTSVFTSSAGNNSVGMAELFGRFTLTVTSVLELQHYTQTARASDGLGIEASASVVEVYADVRIEKL